MSRGPVYGPVGCIQLREQSGHEILVPCEVFASPPGVPHNAFSNGVRSLMTPLEQAPLSVMDCITSPEYRHGNFSILPPDSSAIVSSSVAPWLPTLKMPSVTLVVILNVAGVCHSTTHTSSALTASSEPRRWHVFYGHESFSMPATLRATCGLVSQALARLHTALSPYNLNVILDRDPRPSADGILVGIIHPEVV